MNAPSAHRGHGQQCYLGQEVIWSGQRTKCYTLHMQITKQLFWSFALMCRAWDHKGQGDGWLEVMYSQICPDPTRHLGIWNCPVSIGKTTPMPATRLGPEIIERSCWSARRMLNLFLQLSVINWHLHLLTYRSVPLLPSWYWLMNNMKQ